MTINRSRSGRCQGRIRIWGAANPVSDLAAMAPRTGSGTILEALRRQRHRSRCPCRSCRRPTSRNWACRWDIAASSCARSTRGGANAAPSPTPGATEPSLHSVDAREAERRQITVLFCDMVGSTELANLLDPEDASALIRRYQDACAGAVARFDGYVAKFMGDGVLAYFGYPQANEDAAEHAVRSALAIIDAVGELERPDGRALQVRIGIATGVVVIGDMIGTGSARERSIAGETPNLAARLQALADPDEIIVGPAHPSTARQPLRIREPWRALAQGIRRAGARLARAARGRRGEPLRGHARREPRRIRRSRRGIVAATRSLAARGAGARPGGAHLGRSRHGKVAARRHAVRPHCRRELLPRDLPVFAVSHEQRAPSRHPAPRTCGGIRVGRSRRRQARETGSHAGRDERQSRSCRQRR